MLHDKRKKGISLLVITLSYVLTVTLIFTGLHAIMNKNAPTETPQLPDKFTETPTADNLSSTKTKTASIWIATVGNIDYPTKQGQNAAALAAELDKIVKNALSLGAECIFFQIRPSGDALYKSDLFPASAYVSSKRGEEADGGFDSLAYITKKAHDNGIELHAWVNPTRLLSASADRTLLCADEAGALHPEWVVEYGASLYYDPGLPEVRNYIADGVLEITSRYDVDGVIFDDYFYPYPIKDESGNIIPFDDTGSYAKYGGSLTLDEYRRESVRALVRVSSIAAKKGNSLVKFGISPFGIWKNERFEGGAGTSGLESYYDIWCDSLSFAREGNVDYIAPQLYWEIGYESADFLTLAAWWSDALSGTEAEYIPCLAPYRYKEGRYETGELTRQMEYLDTLPNCSGIALYGYAALCDPTLSVGYEVQAYVSRKK